MNEFNRSGLVVLGIFLLLIIGVGVMNFFGLNLPYLSFLEKGIYNTFSPIIQWVDNSVDQINNYFVRLAKTDEIIAENKNLKKKIAGLRVENLSLQKYKRQNERLRELLNFNELVSYKTEGAEVIGFGPSNWQKKILIGKGKKDGFKQGMPVITYNGTLVGQIDYIGINSAQVKLVSDPNFVVAGIVRREESRSVGLVKGKLKKDDVDIMDNISWEADIKKGDLILTSGLSNTFPKGLPIGKVLKVESDNYGVSQKADIDLFFNLKTVEEVLVITDF